MAPSAEPAAMRRPGATAMAVIEGGMVSGTCEKIGFTDFSTTHFQ
jgi:hypothetical protein